MSRPGNNPSVSIYQRLLLWLLVPVTAMQLAGLGFDYVFTYRQSHKASTLLFALLGIDLLQLGVILVLVWIGVRRGLVPLQLLREQIAARSPRDLSPLEVRAIPAELQRITEAFNRLFAAVREAGQTQQQFLANAAHQLRTPITGLQAQLELLAAEPAAQPLRERLQTLHQGMLRLGRTANQLLALARADPAVNLHREFQPVDLPALVEPLVAEQLDRALAENVELAVEAQPASVIGVPWLLQQLLANLLDNAITYAAPAGLVTVRCGLEGAEPFLEVEDTGIGIAPAERMTVQLRFMRGQEARGMGSGLGLAIVGEIAALHGGTLTIGDGAGGCGARMHVRFGAAQRSQE